jgi:hypothetical protein
MGLLNAMGMAALTDLDTALRWHFQSNCFPPVPVQMVEPAKAAIAAVVDDEADQLIDLPEGVSHRRYGTQMPAGVFCDEMRLEAFVEYEAHADDPPADPDEDDSDDA